MIIKVDLRRIGNVSLTFKATEMLLSLVRVLLMKRLPYASFLSSQQMDAFISLQTTKSDSRLITKIAVASPSHLILLSLSEFPSFV